MSTTESHREGGFGSARRERFDVRPAVGDAFYRQVKQHTSRPRRASLAAETLLPHPPEHVYAFLARLENHWLLHDRYLRLEQLNADGRDSRIAIHTPLGVRRTARMTVTTANDPYRLGGTATIGQHTTAQVIWTIEQRAQGFSTTSPGQSQVCRIN